MSDLITPAEVEHIAYLARLKLSKTEIDAATKQLTEILQHFSVIQDINTDNTATSDDVTGLNNVTRPDQADAECICATDDLLNAVPSTQNKQVKVPAIFE